VCCRWPSAPSWSASARASASDAWNGRGPKPIGAKTKATWTTWLDRIQTEGLRTNLAVKLTQLGLSIDEELAQRNLAELVDHAAERGNFVRIDMEESRHVDATLRIYRGLRERGHDNVGAVLQSYLFRTEADLAARGYTGVLHTFSENDFAYYRSTMAEIVGVSHAEGLAVQASPWGLGRTFGGEAESRWVAFHPEERQVLDDGRRVAAACLNSPAYRDFCKEWADWVLECGVDSVFWDEPAWVVPEHVGVDHDERRAHAAASR